MAYATVQDVETFLQRDLTTVEQAAAQMALDVAERQVDAYVGFSFAEVEDQEVTVRGSSTRYLFLPVSPVSAVTDVSVTRPFQTATDLVDVTDYRWTSDGILLRPVGADWGGLDALVTLTYSYGYAAIPGDVTLAAVEIAAQLLGSGASATSGSGAVTSVTIGDYTERYDSNSSSSFSSMSSDSEVGDWRRLVDRYRLVTVA